MRKGLKMSNLDHLKAEMRLAPQNQKKVANYLKYLGYADHFDAPSPMARAYAVKSLFYGHEKFIYDSDLTAGSVRGLLSGSFNVSDELLKRADKVCRSYGSNGFITNADHFAPDYETFLQDGVGGTLAKIQQSLTDLAHDADFEDKAMFLRAAEISMQAFGRMVAQYGEAAQKQRKKRCKKQMTGKKKI